MQAASAQTDTSNEDGFQQGAKDANRDLQGKKGHGFDDSCPKGHSAVFCDAYKQGYHKTWTPPKPIPTATPVSKQTDTSNEDGFQQGAKDGDRDFHRLNHHGFDNSCPKGHTAAFCDEYKQGYSEGYYDQPKYQPDYDSQQPTKPTSSKQPQNGPHSGGGACSGTPNIIVDNSQQQKVIVKVNTKVDAVTKNVIVNNVVTTPSQGKQPTYLLLLDTAHLCQLAGDTQCVVKQNQFKTLNLVTRLDSTGKTWTITGQAENIAAGTKTQRNVQVIAHFYDSKGNNVGGGLYQGAVNPSVLKSLQSGVFNFKASTFIMKGTPSFLRLEYQAAA